MYDLGEKKPITIVGCGPGSPAYLTQAAMEAVRNAELLVGARRLLELFPQVRAERLVLQENLQQLLDAIESSSKQKRIAVLVRGDPGLFSLGRLVIRRFGPRRCQVIPGISSVQVAFARLGLDWADARIISAHKEDPEPEPFFWDADKIAVLGGRRESLRWLAGRLVEQAAGSRRVFVCEELTLEGEDIREVEPKELAELDASSRTLMLIIKRESFP